MPDSGHPQVLLLDTLLEANYAIGFRVGLSLLLPSLAHLSVYPLYNSSTLAIFNFMYMKSCSTFVCQIHLFVLSASTVGCGAIKCCVVGIFKVHVLALLQWLHGSCCGQSLLHSFLVGKSALLLSRETETLKDKDS